MLEHLILPRPLTEEDFSLIIEGMYAHWLDRTLYDNECSVFPEPDMLESIGIYEVHHRKVFDKALGNLVIDFDSILRERGVDDYVRRNMYRRIKFHRSNVLLY